jgi:hypothetical protein
MKVWMVNNLARQVDGEYCLCFVEYASPNKAKVEAHYNNVKTQLAKVLPTPDGDVKVVIERGIIEVEVDLSE